MFYFGRKNDIYFRSYTKIQEVLANIGGFSQIIYLSINIFYKYLIEHYRNYHLISNIPLDFEYSNSESKKMERPKMDFNYNNYRLQSRVNPVIIQNLDIRKSSNDKLNEVIKINKSWSVLDYLKFKLGYKIKNNQNSKGLILLSLNHEYFAKNLNILTYFKLLKNFKFLTKTCLEASDWNEIKIEKPKLRIEPINRHNDLPFLVNRSSNVLIKKRSNKLDFHK